jgi:membrane protein DedA with SNARE-associated domain
MMTELISQYGYWAVLVGTMLGGESILLPAAFLAARGYLSLPLVIALAVIGSFMSDQVYFLLGRYGAGRIFARWPAVEKQVSRIHRQIESWQDSVVLSFRFYFGLRIVTLFALGSGRMPFRRFVILNLAGAVIWALAFGLGGYFFGAALTGFLTRFKHYEIPIALLLLALIVVGERFFRRRQTFND